MAFSVDFDVVVIGAGISGINTAYHLTTQFPGKSYNILEGRDKIGGTWDLFKYPGIRSDSDLHTFGFPWSPWNEKSTLASGPAIVSYIKESAARFGIDKKIRFRHRVTEGNWSSKTESWSLKVLHDGETQVITCRWVIVATGYYDYETPLATQIPGLEHFKGQVIHPQFWPSDLDYADKRVAIIGSGATAITLLPVLAEKAAHVTMVQRSPTYILSQPKTDTLSLFLKKVLPLSWALYLTRLKNLVLPFIFLKYCQAFPKPAGRLLQKQSASQLPADVPVDPHFKPSYNPWEQRLCVCPGGDFYDAIKSRKASLVTGTIQSVTENSIVLEDGAVSSPKGTSLQPDIIITATGLKIQVIGGAKIYIDGREVHASSKHLWKGALVQDVPNMGFIIGYSNASWTLGAEATARIITRIMKHMDTTRSTCVVPIVEGPLQDRPLLNLSSTYIASAKDVLPKAGDRGPWKARGNYLLDIWVSRYGSILEGLVYR
jgi:cation diffusion facilitator CzcD-associated flavoprotein CzcO